MFPNQPCIIPGWMERSITVSSFPSSMPVNIAWSDFFSTTFTFWIIFAGIFFDASDGSSRKNVLPSIVIFDMVWPFAVIDPSSETSTPGSFLRSSSSISLSEVLNEEALYSIVSFFTTIGFPTAVTFAASRTSISSDIFTSPKSTVLSITTSFS